MMPDLRKNSYNNSKGFPLCLTTDASLPAADHSFAGQRQVEEGLAELEGQGVLQRLAVDDQREVVFFSQRVAQG